MRVSVAVMAHEKRADMVPSVLDALDSPAVVVWDDGSNSRWGTGRAALLAYSPGATHHCVLQDDAILCRDLVAGIEAALEFVPEGSPMGLYIGRQRPMRQRIAAVVDATEKTGDSWVIYEGPLWGVGVVIPTSVIDDLVAYCDRLGTKQYDLRMHRYFQSTGDLCYYPHPSLVEHRENHPSLVPGRTGRGRVAHRFIGAQASALDIDWSKVPSGPIPLPRRMAANTRRR